MEVVQTLREMANRWDFSASMAVLGLLACLPPWRRHTSALALPACAFLLRKTLLFVPVCGAISTVDSVLFYSQGAYFFHLLVPAIVAFWIAVAVSTLRSPHLGGDDRGVVVWLFFICLAGLIVASCFMLPVD